MEVLRENARKFLRIGRYDVKFGLFGFATRIFYKGTVYMEKS